MRPRSNSNKRPRGSGSHSDETPSDEERLTRVKQPTDFTSSKVRLVEFEKTLKDLSDAQNTIKEFRGQEEKIAELERDLTATRESLAAAHEQVVEAVTKPYTAVIDNKQALELVVTDFNNNFSELEHQHDKQIKSLTETLNVANKGQVALAEIAKLKEENKALRAHMPVRATSPHTHERKRAHERIDIKTTEDRKRIERLQEESNKRQSRIIELEKLLDGQRTRGPAEGRDQERETKLREQAKDLRKAQEQVARLVDDKKTLNSQLEEKKNEQEALETKISWLDTQVTALEQEQEGRTQKITSLEEDKADLQRSLGRRDGEEAKLREELSKLRLAAQGTGNITTLQARVKQLERHNADLRAAIPPEEDRQKLPRLEEENRLHRETIDRLEREKGELSSKIPTDADKEQAAKELEELKAKIPPNDHWAHLSGLKDANERLHTENARLKSEIPTDEDKQKAAKELEELRSKIPSDDHWEEYTHLKDANEQLQTENTRLKSEVPTDADKDNAAKVLRDLRAQAEDDRQKLSEYALENGKQKETLERLEKENAELRSIAPSDEDMETAAQQLRDLRSKISDFEAETKKLRDRVKNLETEKEGLNCELGVKAQELQETIEEKDELEVKVDALTGQVDELEQEQAQRDETVNSLEEDKQELEERFKRRDEDLLKALSDVKNLKNEVTLSASKARLWESKNTASLSTISKLHDNLKTTRDLLRTAEGGLSDSQRELKALRIENVGNAEAAKQLQILLDAYTKEGEGRETSKDKDIADLNMEVIRLNTELTKAEGKVKDGEKAIQDLITSKDTEIAKLQGQVRDNSGQAATVLKEAEIKRNEAEIKKLKEDLKDKDSAASREIVRLQESLKEANETIANLRANMSASHPPTPNPPRFGSASSSKTAADVFKVLIRSMTPVTSSDIDIEEERRIAEQKRPTLVFGGPIPPAPSPAKKKKKARARDNEGDEGDDEEDEDEEDEEVEEDNQAPLELDKTGPESNQSFWRAHYSKINLGSTRPNKKEKVNNLNLAIQRVILEALPPDADRKDIDHLQDVWARNGVTEERLNQFRLDPTKYAPKVHNTWLDKSGSTKEELRNSQWNRALMHNLEQLVLLIVRDCGDKNYFAALTAAECTTKFRKHFDRAYAGVISSRPKNDEEEQDPLMLVARLIGERCERNAKSAVVSRRRHKFDRRLKIVYHMRQRSKGDETRFPFWEYARRMVEHLTVNGMSDEEKVMKERPTSGGLLEKYSVMEVLKLTGRHPYFRPFFRAIDATPDYEDISFCEDKSQRYPREYVDRNGGRILSQLGLSRSVFADGYLDQLLEYERFGLQLADEDRPLHTFSLHGFEWPEGSASS
ncbi:hypothetical protein AAF712_011634 [Marasmius tenuissimus]|uniref:Uncharacterized protein n=1 Tax=Marasmius tenuissimus TaxID=585030 RepID=A0ABR2ZIS2_9AGAR